MALFKSLFGGWRAYKRRRESVSILTMSIVRSLNNSVPILSPTDVVEVFSAQHQRKRCDHSRFLCVLHRVWFILQVSQEE